jgi:transposase
MGARRPCSSRTWWSVVERLRVRRADPPPDGGLWTSGKGARGMAGALGREAVSAQRGWEALRRIGWSLQKPRPRHPKAATPEAEAAFQKLDEVAAEVAARRPDLPGEVFATDEHRLGLKPVLRRVWAPKGERPIALGPHRYKGLYVTAFTQPLSGETVWSVSTGISKAFFAALLAAFAEETRAGRERSIGLVLDQAGWHTEPNRPVPDGIRLVYLPRSSPELQPAEHLWPVLDEPVVNTYFATLADLEAVIAQRCIERESQDLRTGTNFYWWPNPVQPK